MNIVDLKLRVQLAVNTLYARDSMLLSLEVSEWALAHRLAVYLEQEFPGWNIDCEYNKQGEHSPDPKTNAATVGTTERTRPDIILHHRGELSREHNLLVIELKKASDPTDCKKAMEFTALPSGARRFQYQYGLALSFLPSLKTHWYENGMALT
jgi:hypothetical protein